MEPTQDTTHDYTSAGLARRGRRLILSGVVALAAIGYFVGLRAGVPEGPAGFSAARRGASPSAEDAVPTLSYDQVGAGQLRTAAGSVSWDAFVTALRAPDRAPATDLDARRRSLALRGERRAYNGAPPTIPHDTRGLNAASCLACHGEDLQIGSRVAKRLPHPYLTNCTQCHAVSAPAFLASQGSPGTPNGWRGLATPLRGTRAAPGAPPLIPHSTQMRTNCLACHGPNGWPGVQTSHPERSSCLQCHAPTSDREHPGLDVPGARFQPGPRVHSDGR